MGGFPASITDDWSAGCGEANGSATVGNGLTLPVIGGFVDCVTRRHAWAKNSVNSSRVNNCLNHVLLKCSLERTSLCRLWTLIVRSGYYRYNPPGKFLRSHPHRRMRY